jgi:replicative DNA helicase
MGEGRVPERSQREQGGPIVSAVMIESDSLARMERHLLGCAMLNPSVVFTQVDTAGSEFANSDFGELWNAMREMHAQGIPVDDLSILLRRLKNTAAFRCVGAAEIGRIAVEIPNVANAVFYGDELRKASRLRQVREQAERAIRAADQGDADAAERLLAQTTRDGKQTDPNSPWLEGMVGSLDAWLERLLTGNIPLLTPQHSALKDIEIGSGLVTVIGAYQGVGKTALTSQIIFDAMELDPDLRAIIANAESDAAMLLRRQIGRGLHIPASALRFGKLTDEERDKVARAAGELRSRLTRVSQLAAPYRLHQLMRLMNEEPGLLIVDYLQKFVPIESRDIRVGINLVMDGLRELARAGWAVIAISATNRPTKDSKSKDKSLTVHSLRESSEIEFQADSIYLLHDDGPVDAQREWLRNMTLEHVKNRHGEMRDIQLEFHRPRLEFTAASRTAPTSEFAGDFIAMANPFCAAERF